MMGPMNRDFFSGSLHGIHVVSEKNKLSFVTNFVALLLDDGRTIKAHRH